MYKYYFYYIFTANYIFLKDQNVYKIKMYYNAAELLCS